MCPEKVAEETIRILQRCGRLENWLQLGDKNVYHEKSFERNVPIGI